MNTVQNTDANTDQRIDRNAAHEINVNASKRTDLNVTERIQKIGIVPIVVLHDINDAVPLAKALTEGGLPCAEITFRTEAAEEAIRIMTSQFPDMLVGAGTILTKKQTDQAIRAGANFIVCPGFDPEIVDDCLEQNIPVFPGCVTPSDAARAVKCGLKTIKFFPAESFGGVDTIKALAAPYPTLNFMPTGGISPSNLGNYLSFPKVIACGGSWMVNHDLIREGRFEEISALAKEAVQLVERIRSGGKVS